MRNDRFINIPRGTLMKTPRITHLLQSATIPILLLLVWEAATRSGVWPRTLIASPSEVVSSLARLAEHGELAIHAFVSLRRLSAGFLIGSAVGIATGAVVGLSRWAERALAPTIQLLAPIPIVAWIPLLIIVFGIGEPSKIAVIALGTFFVTFFNAADGIRSADQKLVEVAHLYNKTPFQILVSVLLPSALPNVFLGLRVALGLSWILLIVGEIIASSKGLGWLIWDSRNFSRPDDMIAGMVIVGLLGKLTDQALAMLQSWALRWRSNFQGL